MLAYAQKQFRKTRAEGREEGLRQGREETLRRNVRRMRASGMTTALVAEILDLPEEEVGRLAEEDR